MTTTQSEPMTTKTAPKFEAFLTVVPVMPRGSGKPSDRVSRYKATYTVRGTGGTAYTSRTCDTAEEAEAVARKFAASSRCWFTDTTSRG